MERKVTEWGCMQALIDYDGWRKWKQYADEKAKEDPAIKEREEQEDKAKTKAQLKAMFARKPPSSSQSAEKKEEKKDEGSLEPKKQANGGPVGGNGPGKKQPTATPSTSWQGGNHKRRGGSGSQSTISTLGPTPEADEG